MMTNEKAIDYWLNHERVDDKEQSEAVWAAIAALHRTAEDDKAREEGRLVELPCNTGDTLFVADRYKGKIYKRTVERFTVGKNGYLEIWVGTTISVNAKQLGKTVFLTREDAEAAISERGGEDE